MSRRKSFPPTYRSIGRALVGRGAHRQQGLTKFRARAARHGEGKRGLTDIHLKHGVTGLGFPQPHGIDRQGKGRPAEGVSVASLRSPGLATQHQQQGDESLHIANAKQQILRLVEAARLDAKADMGLTGAPVARHMVNNARL